MKLREIEINGFKSFADKTQMKFHDGITCIVGPNGCGKSNVVDVTKWILGEQSVKSLRGKEMTDVIFNGTTGRKALGFAEASMVVDNRDRLLGLDSDQIKITRKVHRTGEGEYHINNQPARLKDIKELFMDTGVGTRSYSVMEQGQIESFINSNSKDRRKLFEEAAGISRYKNKKEEATRKLEKVEQNLLRINDIIDEVEDRLKRVTLQAQKARRYQNLVDELKKLRVSYSVLFLHSINEKRDKVSEELKTLEDKVSEVVAKLSQIESDSARIGKEQSDLEHEIQKAEGERANFQASLAEMETDQGWARRSIKDIRNENDLLEAEVSSSSLKIKDQADRIIALEKELHDSESNIDTQSEATIKIEEERNSLQNEIRRLIETVDEKKQGILKRMNEKIRLESDISRLRTEHHMLEMRMTELTEQSKTLGVQRSTIEETLNSLKGLVQNTENKKAELANKVSDSKNRLVAIENRVYDVEKEIARLNSLGAAKESRLHILQDLELRNEGLAGGVKSILEALKKNNNIGRIRGIVADLFSVDPQYALAIETFLGFRAQEIVTDTALDAKKAIDFLKANKHGRCTFLPLDRVKGRRRPDGTILGKPGVIGLAVDLIEYDKEYSNVMSRILGQVYLVETIDHALELTKNTDLHEFLVTLDGEVFAPDGAISGGTRRDSIGIITRKNEITALKKELETTATTMGELASEHAKIKEEKRDIASSLDQLVNNLQETSILLSRYNSELEEKKRENSQFEQRLQESQKSHDQYSLQSQEALAKVEVSRAELEELQKHGNDIEENISEQEKELRKKEATLSTLNEEVTEAKLLLSSIRERKNRAVNEKNIIENGVNEQRERITRDEKKIEDNKKRIEELEIKIETLTQKISEYIEQNSTKEVDIRGLVNKRESLRQLLHNINDEADVLRKDDRRLSESINELKMKLHEIELNASNMKDKVWEEYRVNVDEFLAELSKEELEDIKSSDQDLLEKEIKDAENKIRNIGAVNIDAIQEQDVLEERFQFLSKQRNDLVNGKNSLSDVISEINIVSRELFVKTFEEIRVAFQDMFRRLFGGGRADIVLQEGVDVLDAGIEIFAKPPGKENRSISLLSGGEKVMTTISLLFAVFKTKPSPFCILDEIDAALDEANIDRFMAVLQEFLSFTQFIIISHNRRTMSMADEIYGVTMEEKGVSKAFTMKLEALA